MSNQITSMIRDFISSIDDRACRFLSMLSSWRFRKIILIGLVPRLLLMPFTAHPFDVQVWYNICEDLIGGLPFGRFLASSRPLWLLTLVPVAYIYDFLSSITGLKAIPVSSLPLQMNPQFGAAYVTDPLFNFLVKTPMLAADIATTIVVYRMVMESQDAKSARKTALPLYSSIFVPL